MHPSLTMCAAAVVMAFAGQAAAHAHLVRADPAAATTLKTSPPMLRATFSEKLVPQFSTLVVTTAKGAPVATSKAALDPKDAHTLMVMPAGPLPPGDYVVEWRAVSTDTHRMMGRYGFRIRP